MKRIRSIGIAFLSTVFFATSASALDKVKVGDTELQLYGYIKVDGAYDDSKTKAGDYVVYVPKESNKNKDDDKFNLVARESRIGLRIFRPYKDTDWLVRTEIDFFGLSGTANKSTVLLRHLYLNVDFPWFSMLVGQTSDIISQQNPTTLNYTVLWNTGNIGYRHPQLRFTKKIEVNEAVLGVEAGIRRSIGEDIDGQGTDDGEDSGVPTFAGRLSLTMPLFGKKKMIVAFSGHYGKEEVDWGTDKESKDTFESWSMNGEVVLPLWEWGRLKGEGFRGKNLDESFGGIGQGVNIDSKEEIDTYGGWGELSIYPLDQLELNTGFGIEDPGDSDLNRGNRSRNSAFYSNIILRRIYERLDIGFEFSSWKTKYKLQGLGTNHRYQMSLIFPF